LASDLRIALRATGGPEAPYPSDLQPTRGPKAPYSWELRPPRHRDLKDFRVGVVTDHPAAPVSSEVGEALSGTVDRLARSGAKIVEGWPDGVEPSEQAEEFGRQVGVFFALHGGEPTSMTVDQLVAAERGRMIARTKWQRYFEDVDVFLCPTSFTVAFPHGSTTIDGQPYDAQVFWIAHASLTGHPALSMPIGRTQDGLPVGGQVIGPWHEDDTAITFAELLAD
jgi:amidase